MNSEWVRKEARQWNEIILTKFWVIYRRLFPFSASSSTTQITPATLKVLRFLIII